MDHTVRRMVSVLQRMEVVAALVSVRMSRNKIKRTITCRMMAMLEAREKESQSVRSYAALRSYLYLAVLYR